MRAFLQRLTPQTLVGRLLLSTLAALAVAQLVLILVLEERKNAVVRGVIEQQALAQTATLYNLITQTPASDMVRVASGFHSAGACSEIVAAPPAQQQGYHGENDFADRLTAMLATKLPSAPQVEIQQLDEGGVPCAVASEADHHHNKTLLVTAFVPLNDGQWLSLKSAVEFPDTANGSIALLFMLASLAVAGVAFWAARTQTKSLTLLADASRRFGRGEAVSPLLETGPSEVVEATKAFNTMQQRQGEFIKDRMKLLAAVGHDLRTPLTTLRLKAEFVKDKAAQKSLIATIDEMTVITEATLAFTRAEATAEKTVQVDLAQLLRDLCAEKRPDIERITISDLADVTYACRPVALKRALRNLIDNALRYGGGAHVSLAKENRGIVIAIEDQGPGIAPEQIDQAFEPFVRLEQSRSIETGGIGMGLAIARGIVKAHGGSIALLNRAQGGLRAEVVLPLA